MKKKFNFKLPKAAKRTWLKALRSGKYKQGAGALKAEGRYCCLGVARACGLTARRSDGAEFVRNTFLPADIQRGLAEKNDSTRWSFKRIANWIEKHL